jgi:hypothetical protein
MSTAQWQQLLLEPEQLSSEPDYSSWFDSIAHRLLCGCRLMVAGQPHRFTEVEFYYHGGTHPDTFTHRDPIQKGTGLWYFHRTNGVYRGGSFKGFDLTFGGSGAFGGVLIRGMESEGGPLIDGPSLSVDHLLKRTEHNTVASLDEAIEMRPAWEKASPVYLEWLEQPREHTILKSSRVGLSLKRLRHSEGPPRYILRPYRYLSESKRISKGKLHMVMALHTRGLSVAEIREQTGCNKGAIERYIADYEIGAKESEFTPYFGIDLGPKELARLHGLWQSKYGPK